MKRWKHVFTNDLECNRDEHQVTASNLLIRVPVTQTCERPAKISQWFTATPAARRGVDLWNWHFCRYQDKQVWPLSWLLISNLFLMEFAWGPNQILLVIQYKSNEKSLQSNSLPISTIAEFWFLRTFRNSFLRWLHRIYCSREAKRNNQIDPRRKASLALPYCLCTL